MASAMFNLFPPLSSSRADYWLFTILLYISVMGIANLISVMVPGKGKGLIANGLIVILWSFGGESCKMQ